MHLTACAQNNLPASVSSLGSARTATTIHLHHTPAIKGADGVIHSGNMAYHDRITSGSYRIKFAYRVPNVSVVL